jgi:NADH:ubiquinone oxidoreductase subunit
LFAGSSVPVPVREILQRACQDCHSANTVWPWYSHVPVMSGQIRNDVKKGLEFMDLSRWNDYTETQRWSFTVAIDSAIRNHQMPPAKYVWMHGEARLSPEEQQLVRAWVLSSRRTASKKSRPQQSTQDQIARSEP